MFLLYLLFPISVLFLAPTFYVSTSVLYFLYLPFHFVLFRLTPFIYFPSSSSSCNLSLPSSHTHSLIVMLPVPASQTLSLTLSWGLFSGLFRTLHQCRALHLCQTLHLCLTHMRARKHKRARIRTHTLFLFPMANSFISFLQSYPLSSFLFFPFLSFHFSFNLYFAHSGIYLFHLL